MVVLALPVVSCGGDVASSAPEVPAPAAAHFRSTVVGVPLIDMTGGQRYKGFEGLLYPSGNRPPSHHAAEGSRRAAILSGRFVMMSLGMSNAKAHFNAFLKQVASDSSVNPNLLVVNGAQGGQTPEDWIDSKAPTFDVARDRLRQEGATEADVRVLWILQANRFPHQALPASDADAYTLLGGLGDIVRTAKIRYPNLELVFLSSRIYSCARKGLNPEPFAYESGFSVKWLIEAQIDQIATGRVDPVAGDLDYRTGVAPWLGWAAYLWADDGNPRSDGLSWQREDLIDDCVHPSASGRSKAANLLMTFFKTSPQSSPWFLR